MNAENAVHQLSSLIRAKLNTQCKRVGESVLSHAYISARPNSVSYLHVNKRSGGRINVYHIDGASSFEKRNFPYFCQNFLAQQ